MFRGIPISEISMHLQHHLKMSSVNEKQGKTARHIKIRDERKKQLLVNVTGHRPTFKNIHHVEKGQRQRRLPAACATADSHLTEQQKKL